MRTGINKDNALSLIKLFDLKAMKWRHHGLGMLQAEIDEQHRLHIWDPCLRTFPDYGFRDVHNHRFGLRSTVLVGSIYDVKYSVKETETPLPVGGVCTGLYEVKHAKKQKHDSSDFNFIDRVIPSPVHIRQIKKGESYTILRGDFHTSKVFGLAVTFMERWSFSKLPARILGDPKIRGIVLDGFEVKTKEVLEKAREAISNA